MKPRLLKKTLALSSDVSPGIIPQKQGTAQFIGSIRSGCIVALAWAGSNVLRGACVRVSEGVLDGKLTTRVGMVGFTPVFADVSVDSAIGRAVVDCTGRAVVRVVVQPANAKTRIKQRDSKENGFI